MLVCMHACIHVSKPRQISQQTEIFIANTSTQVSISLLWKMESPPLGPPHHRYLPSFPSRTAQGRFEISQQTPNSKLSTHFNAIERRNTLVSLGPFPYIRNHFLPVQLKVFPHYLFPDSITHVRALKPFEHREPDSQRLYRFVVAIRPVLTLRNVDCVSIAGFVLEGCTGKDHGLDADEDLQDGRFSRLPLFVRISGPGSE